MLFIFVHQTNIVMKKLITILSLLLFSAVAIAQGGPLKFLGIPIDGTEAQFVSKLKNKGFIYNGANKSYKGQFNGHNVDVYIHTNHNIVDRVYVAFPRTSEQDIRRQFNSLLSQFEETGKYLPLSINEEIPSDEDISHEITVNNKRYQAIFSYFDADRDQQEFMNAMLDKFSDFYTEEQLATLKEYCQKSIDSPEASIDVLMDEMVEELGISQDCDTELDPIKAFQSFLTMLERMRSLADGEVWFMIHEEYGRYNLGLYYDNLHNRPHGEDL